MVYADEDEIDWSDGSFGAPSRIPIDAIPSSTTHNSAADAHEDEDSLFVSETYDPHRIPSGFSLEAAPLNSNDTFQNPSRVQRARAGVHLNRRIPSKADYVNYVLYQASQKAYEATFLNNFIAHALHPDRLAQCSEDATSGCQSIAEYMKSVSHEVNGITKKMIWNGHCRTVHLLAGDGMDGAPFLDLHTLDTRLFSKYGPGNLFPVADRVNVSWHRTSSNPSMVRYSTKEYELGYQTGPLEDLDAVSQTLFRKENFGVNLPIGRAVKPSTSKKRKGQNMPGAATRDDTMASSRRNWIPFPQLATMSDFHDPQSITSSPLDIGHEAKAADVHQEPRILSNLAQLHHDPVDALSPDDAQEEGSHLPFPSYEELFGPHDPEVPISDRGGTGKLGNGTEHVEKVHHWRTRLINDHKRRLTLKWGNPPQALDHAFQNFKQVVAAAMSVGIRPIDHDYPKKLDTIAAWERLREQGRNSARSQQNSQSLSAETTTADSRASQCLPVVSDVNTPESSSFSRPQSLRRDIGGSSGNSNPDKTSSEPFRKRRRKNEPAVQQVMKGNSTQQQLAPPKSGNQSTNQSMVKSPSANKSLSLHPSGSTTLEPHQHLPPNAYFEPTSVNEKYAWRCRCKHAMGHYYNSGNRKNCRGCNTSLSDNHAVEMDFYMPLRSFYHQPAPDMRWKPSKQTARLRKSDRPCHNAVAKDAYWEAVGTGATEEEARQIAVDAVIHYLRPKPPRKAPTPETTPESEPEPDFGPHPSGSTTMEHGQEIPDGYYWKKHKADEKLAWRCDVNHGLGRYYLAGDKKTCPGCGAGRTSLGKSADMDFYLPSGVVVRQEAPGLSMWKPRKPYKIVGKSAATKREPVSHNQMCAKVYFELLAEGNEVEEALVLAIERVDSELDKKQEAKMKRQEAKEEVGDSDAVEGASTSVSVSRRDSAATSRNSRGGCTMSLIPKKRTMDDVIEESLDEVVGGFGDRDMGSERESGDSVVVSSSDEEDSSASDSE